LFPEKRSSSVLLGDLDQRDAGVVRAGAGEARDIDGLAALQPLADRGDRGLRELAVNFVEATTGQRTFAEAACDFIARSRNTRMPRTGTNVRFTQSKRLDS
jgi:hypothetical protein